MKKLLLVVLLQVVAFAEASQSNRYNVLFIAVDDLRPELGCYGVAHARTPNLDRLADSGVVFRNHFAQVPTCGASRYSLLTGRSPANSGVTQNNWPFVRGSSALLIEQQEGAQTLPELFRRSGYRTVCLGKISHTADGRVFEYDGTGDGRPEMPHAWDELPTPFGAWKRGWGIFFGYMGGRSREDGGDYRPVMEFLAERDEQLPDGLLAEAAIDHLRLFKQGQQPFFLGLGFFKPHLPFVATRADWEAFEALDIPLATNKNRRDTAYWHKSNEFYRYQFPFPKDNPLPESHQRQAKRGYLAATRYVDRQIGKVLDELSALGLAENTVVVIWGDHGWHLGDFQIWGKHTPLERAVRSAFLMRVPGIEPLAREVEALVSSLDIYPTLVELCRPSFSRTRFPLDGQSLVPLINGDIPRVHEAVLSFWRDSISVRTETHRLVVTEKEGTFANVELYDLSKDPDSSVNVALSESSQVEKMLKYVPND